ncbi:MAG: leucine-rich repeat domain-containing protein [Bacteroidales bacterium]|nr:leucine-rich repeat domain-containing protein [Bacteroidales bacterium]
MISKIKLVLISVCLIVGLSKVYAVEVRSCVAGTLSMLVEDKCATELVVGGEIDARDLKFIATELNELSVLDLSGTKILAYKADEPCFGDILEYGENSLPDYCFFAKKYTSVKLPAELSVIGEGTFAGCKQIANIDFPRTLNKIGKYAFSSCDALGKVSFSSRMAEISEGAFMRCVGLKTADLSALTADCELGEGIFADCVLLESVKIGESVKKVPSRAFAGCVLLSDVDFGDVSSLEFVGEEAFSSTAIGFVNLEKFNNLSTIGDWAFAGMSCSEIVVPEGISIIGEGAFLANESVINVNLPSTLNEIGRYAFAGDALLQEMSVMANNVPTLGENVWLGVVQGDVTVTVPEESVELYRAANQWCEFKIIGDATTIETANIMSGFKAFFNNGCLVIMSSDEIEKVEVYNTSGLCIAAVAPMSTTASVDMGNAQANVYVASILLKNGKQKTIKFVKE